MTPHNALSRPTVRRLYNRIGRWQDNLAFYAEPALDVLLRHGSFDTAETVLEVGPGTGRLAARLLRDECPPETRYVAMDVSPRMIEIARDRLSSYRERVDLRKSDGGFSFDWNEGSVDRVVATYVLDLLPDTDVQAFLAESRRVLTETGRLCLAGLTWGEDGLSRFISRLWAAVYRWAPVLVGGCRPIRATDSLAGDQWTVLHREGVSAWGVPSEVIIASPA